MKKLGYILYVLIFIFGSFRGMPVFAEASSETNEVVVEESEEESEKDAEGEVEIGEEEGEDEENEEGEDETDEEDDGTETNKKVFFIKAVNAGKKEFIELYRAGDEPIFVSKMSVIYTNKSGNASVIYTFPENSIFVGRNIVLGYSGAEMAEKSDFQYKTNLSKDTGKVVLVFEDTEIDMVCWGGYQDCEATQKLNEKTAVFDLETLETSFRDDYEPEWEEGREVLRIIEEEGGEDEGDEDEEDKEKEEEENKPIEEDLEAEEVEPVCQEVEFSELFSYFSDDRAEQFIELFNPSEKVINLEGCSLFYKNKSYQLSGEIKAKEFFVVFPEKLGLLLTKNPTKSNIIELVDEDGSVIDSLEYYNGQKKGVSFAKFRDLAGETESWEFTKVLTPGAGNKRVEEVFEEKTEEEIPEPVCRGIQFSEILTFFETEKSEQFIELFNPTAKKISLDGCSLRYRNKTFRLFGAIAPEGFYLYFPTEFSLTKNPVNSNKLEIIDADGSVVDSLEYYNGQKKGVSFAQFGYLESGKEQWLQTYSPTPGEENDFQKYKTCPAGKVINELTGNCVNATPLSTELTPCPEGSYRNPLTNRCKKYVTTASATLKDCPEGYERNPATNRCRKIVENDGAEFSVKEEDFEEKSSFLAVWAIVAVGGVGILYIIFEYRNEIFRIFRKKKGVK